MAINVRMMLMTYMLSLKIFVDSKVSQYGRRYGLDLPGRNKRVYISDENKICNFSNFSKNMENFDDVDDFRTAYRRFFFNKYNISAYFRIESLKFLKNGTTEYLKLAEAIFLFGHIAKNRVEDVLDENEDHLIEVLFTDRTFSCYLKVLTFMPAIMSTMNLSQRKSIYANAINEISLELRTKIKSFSTKIDENAMLSSQPPVKMDVIKAAVAYLVDESEKIRIYLDKINISGKALQLSK